MKSLINNEVQSSKKNKSSKFLKTCFVSCLATCLTLTGIFAFAPLGVSAQTNSNNQNLSLNNDLNNPTTSTTESTGLITTRADDPILFTTESGIEIKYGNATIQGNLESGNLAGFPYFETISDDATYTWVLIGFGFGEGTVDLSPAAMNFYGDVHAALRTTVGAPPNMIVSTSEIPLGSALFLCNNCVSTGAYNTRYVVNSYGNHYRSEWVHSNIREAFQIYYTDDKFGFGDLKEKKLHPINLITQDDHTLWNGRNFVVSSKLVSSEDTFFILSSSNNSHFYYKTYLTDAQFALDTPQWLRGRESPSIDYSDGYLYADAFSNDAKTTFYTNNTTLGYRPACIIKLFY